MGTRICSSDRHRYFIEVGWHSTDPEWAQMYVDTRNARYLIKGGLYVTRFLTRSLLLDLSNTDIRANCRGSLQGNLNRTVSGAIDCHFGIS